MLLDRFFIEALIGENIKFDMYIKVDEKEKILETNIQIKRGVKQ